MTEEKAVKKPTNLEESTYARTIWCVKPEIKVTVEDMLVPGFWAHVAKRFKAGDHIEAVPDDRHYFAEFFVLAASDNWAKLVLLRETTLIKDDVETSTEGPIVKWGGRDKWRVIDGSEVLSKGHDDKDAANAWLKEHKKEIR